MPHVIFALLVYLGVFMLSTRLTTVKNSDSCRNLEATMVQLRLNQQQVLSDSSCGCTRRFPISQHSPEIESSHVETLIV